MSQLSFIGIVFGLATIVGSADAAERAESRRAIALRVIDTANVPLTITQQALEHASQIFKRIGVKMIWDDVGCLESEVAAAPLIVDMKVVAHGPELVGAVPRLVGAANPLPRSPTLWVFYRDVQEIAEQRTLSADRLFGFVIAHELGHLLLGPDAHSSWGLMRPLWNPDDIRRGVAQGQFQFTTDEADRIRRRLQ